MLDFHERRKLKSILYSWPVSVGLLVIALLLFIKVIGLYHMERDVAEKREDKVAELSELQARAAALEADVKYLKSERGIESEIRDRYEVAKEGEQVIVIVDDPSAHGTPTTPKSEPVRRSLFDWLIFW